MFLPSEANLEEGKKAIYQSVAEENSGDRKRVFSKNCVIILLHTKDLSIFKLKKNNQEKTFLKNISRIFQEPLCLPCLMEVPRNSSDSNAGSQPLTGMFFSPLWRKSCIHFESFKMLIGYTYFQTSCA